MDFKKSKPIYMQIADTLCERILSGEWEEGNRIPSIREVAAALGVNPNTAMRSFDFLQMNDIIYPQRGEGYYLTPKAKDNVLALHRKEFLQDEAPYLLNRMKLLGITWEELQQASPKSHPEG